MYLNASNSCIDCPKYCQECTLNLTNPQNLSSESENYSESDLQCNVCSTGYSKNSVGVCLSPNDGAGSGTHFLQDNITIIILISSFTICLICLFLCLCCCYKSGIDRRHQTIPVRSTTNISASTEISGKLPSDPTEKKNTKQLAQTLLQSNLTANPGFPAGDISIQGSQPNNDNSMSRLDKDTLGFPASPTTPGGFQIYKTRGTSLKQPIKAKLLHSSSQENSLKPSSGREVDEGKSGLLKLVREKPGNLRVNNCDFKTKNSQEKETEDPNNRQIKKTRLVDSGRDQPSNEGGRRASSPMWTSKFEKLPPLRVKMGAEVSIPAKASRGLLGIIPNQGAVPPYMNQPRIVQSSPPMENQLSARITPNSNSQNPPTDSQQPASKHTFSSVKIESTHQVRNPESIPQDAEETASVKNYGPPPNRNDENSRNRFTIRADNQDEDEVQAESYYENEAFESVNQVPTPQPEPSPQAIDQIIERDPLGDSSMDIERELNDTKLALPRRDIRR
jgi:hypothetical protein